MKFLILLFFLYSCKLLNSNHCDWRDHVIVQESKKSYLKNSIFTKAVAIYVEYPKRTSRFFKDSTNSFIKQAYHRALTIWGTSLSLIQNQLNDSVKKYLSNVTYYGEGNSVYNAPMVDLVSCKDDASVIIKVFTTRKKIFTDTAIIALSQMPGRTILLNCNDFKFYFKPSNFDIALDNHLNLVVVFIHEIGHSLGMKHVKLTQGWSIMSPNYKDLRYGISRFDGHEFSQILNKVVTESFPGRFNPSDCKGLSFK